MYSLFIKLLVIFEIKVISACNISAILDWLSFGLLFINNKYIPSNLEIFRECFISV